MQRRLMEPLPPSRYSSSPLYRINELQYLTPFQHQHTILNFSDASFQVVQRQIADLISKAVEIHAVVVINMLD